MNVAPVLPYLVLDIDGVLQAPAMKYGHELSRTIVERQRTADVHPSMWPRSFHGYAAQRRRRDHITFRTHVRVSPALFEDLGTLTVQVVMLTTWLENGASHEFLAQALPDRMLFPSALHLEFPGRTGADGMIPPDWKVQQLRALLAADPRPFIWVDDDEVPVWGAVLNAELADLPHVCIGPDSNSGITREHVRSMRAFLQELGDLTPRM